MRSTHAPLLLPGSVLVFLMTGALISIARWFHPAVFTVTAQYFVFAVAFVLLAFSIVKIPNE